MIQDTQDRRVRRTRMRLQQAMLELLKEKDARSITVRELTQRADVNRGTFYAHYKDVFDLLDQMEQDLFQRLTQLLSSYSTQDLQRGLTPPAHRRVPLCPGRSGAAAGLFGPAHPGFLFPAAGPADL